MMYTTIRSRRHGNKERTSLELSPQVVKSEMIIFTDSTNDLLTEAKMDAEHTSACTTLRSRSSSLRTSLQSRGGWSLRSNSNTFSSCPQEQVHHEEIERVRNRKILGSLFSKMKIRTKQWSRRRKTISENNLRKQLTKYAERGDWDDVKKLLSNYDFAAIPMPTINGADSSNSSHEAKSSSAGAAGRRPSYGSRNSFARNSESAAAAAAIKAALFDEGSSASAAPSSDSHSDVGENVLHDMCRCKPPLDVFETLLTSLRHRRAYTSGKDHMGRTPLHVAAACGASPDIIEALALADPSPASIGDLDRRTPLHIAVRNLAYNRQEENHPQEANERLTPPPSSVRQDEPLDEEAFEQITTTISILKEVMMAHPGEVDFKDEDKMGYSPLDYAIDGNITDESVLHCLLRRKGLTTSKRRSTSASTDTQVTQNFHKPLKRAQLHSDASSTCSQDIQVLLRLEDEEIADRRKKVEAMRSRQQKVTIQNKLFDMFGIDQERGEVLPCVEQEGNKRKEVAQESPKDQSAEKAEKVSDTHDLQRRPRRRNSRKMLGASFRSNFTSSSSKQIQKSMASEDIYNAHLDAYLDGLVEDHHPEFRAEDDSFDIFHDPEEDDAEEELNDSIHGCGRPPIIEIDIQLKVMDEILNDDDLSHCSFGRSVISEISVPAIFR